MGYSYFVTRCSAEKWARENLDNNHGIIVIEQLSRQHRTDYRQWYVYYPLMAIKLESLSPGAAEDLL